MILRAALVSINQLSLNQQQLHCMLLYTSQCCHSWQSTWQTPPSVSSSASTYFFCNPLACEFLTHSVGVFEWHAFLKNIYSQRCYSYGILLLWNGIHLHADFFICTRSSFLDPVASPCEHLSSRHFRSPPISTDVCLCGPLPLTNPPHSDECRFIVNTQTAAHCVEFSVARIKT